MSPNTNPGPHYVFGRSLRIVLRKHSHAAKKRVRKILKRRLRERMAAQA